MPNATYPIQRYTPALRDTWDAFVSASRNGTFLLQRGFMDYHADRFTDHSLLFYRNEKLIALLPAEEREGWLTSHGGLTYGGFIVGADGTAVSTLKCFEALKLYLKEETQIHTLRYSPPPSFYATYPTEEDRYALFRLGARLSSLKLSSVIPLGAPLPPNQLRKRKAKACLQAGLRPVNTADWAAFWTVLKENLAARHATQPVHTLQEILLLRERFPEHIHLHCTADSEGNIHGGCVVFETTTTAHVQYIASTPYGREVGALDGLFQHLIQEVYAHKQWFDFGISTELGGALLNEGLVMQKEGFGARAVNYETWELLIKEESREE
ncbi:MAG: GNAT family N-acetyltransferase [Bacteroidaceae bacterium]|nr:GNAT family N-acetyltransferase [Bacteroidaceae bacterium]